jgi:hypothetical protein
MRYTAIPKGNHSCRIAPSLSTRWRGAGFGASVHRQGLLPAGFALGELGDLLRAQRGPMLLRLEFERVNP